jgi:serine/threonine protein kinase
MVHLQSVGPVLKDLPSNRPSDKVGEYEIVSELARGGMGCVYLARRNGEAGFQRHFAIKVMNQGLTSDPEALSMLLDEAHITSRLHHPNVVSVLDIGISDGSYYLVMDYVEGCSLQELLQRSREDRPSRQIVPIMLDALHGLHAVHSLRTRTGEPYCVIHRDISPHNLLVGLDGACRVTDFGIAKAAERFAHTQTGIYKGKLAYMAPEQIREAEGLDHRIDIWSAGVTLYTALTGRHPFRGSNDAATLHGILCADILPPSKTGLCPPACFDDVVLKALAREPDERFQTAREFAAALREAALEHGMLGASSEVSDWVERAFSKGLIKSERRIRNIMPQRRQEPQSGEAKAPRRISRKVDAKPEAKPMATEHAAIVAPAERAWSKALGGGIVAGLLLGLVAIALQLYT